MFFGARFFGGPAEIVEGGGGGAPEASVTDTSFYGTMATTAKALISKKGRAITIARPANEYDPATDAMTSDDPTSGTFQAVILPATKSTLESFDNRLLNGTLADDTVRFILAAAKGTIFEPKPADIATFDGSDWIVLGCTPLNPAGTALIYKLAVKK